jgi:hypothetical protein
MPESTKDRCTKSHEYIFLLSKKPFYYFDQYAISTEVKDSSVKRLLQDVENQKGSEKGFGGKRHNGPTKAMQTKVPHGWHQHDKFNNRDPREKRSKEEINYGINGNGFQGHSGYFDKDGNLIGNGRANKKSVWTINTRGTSIDHYATYPEELPVDPIKASTSDHGCCSKCGAPYIRTYSKKLTPRHNAPKTVVIDERNNKADKQSKGDNLEKDGFKVAHYYEYGNFSWKPGCKCKDHKIIPCVVMDIFSGYNTTGMVARKLLRNFVSIEKSPYYSKQSDKRLESELGLFR